MPGETIANTARRNPARADVYQPSEMTKHTFQYPKVTPVSPIATPSLHSAGTTPAQGSGSGRRSS